MKQNKTARKDALAAGKTAEKKNSNKPLSAYLREAIVKYVKDERRDHHDAIYEKCMTTHFAKRIELITANSVLLRAFCQCLENQCAHISQQFNAMCLLDVVEGGVA